MAQQVPGQQPDGRGTCPLEDQSLAEESYAACLEQGNARNDFQAARNAARHPAESQVPIQPEGHFAPVGQRIGSNRRKCQPFRTARLGPFGTGNAGATGTDRAGHYVPGGKASGSSAAAFERTVDEHG